MAPEQDQRENFISLISQIRSLRLQLEAMEARLREMAGIKPHTFADLYGMLKDESHSTDEEIEAALYPNPRPEEW